MAVFAVIARNNQDALGASISRTYGTSVHQFAENVWFVSDVGNTKSVGDKLGITNGVVASGIVLTLTGYSGFAPTAGWTWLAQHPEARSNG